METACLFKYEDPNFIVNYKDEDIKLSLTIDTILDIITAYKRLKNDMMKDGAEFPKIQDLPLILSNVLKNPGKTFDSSTNYKKELETMYESEAMAPRGKEVIHYNVLKTSTTGELSDEYSSQAEIVVYESGTGPNKLCINHNTERFKNIGSSAALLDPASKVDPSHFFPDNSITAITFDKTFTEKLGFPYDLEWSTTMEKENLGSFNVTIKFDDPFTHKKFSETTKVTWQDPIAIKSDTIRELVVGNKEKNTEINKLWKVIKTKRTFNEKDKAILSKIYKLLLMKELGDVAQVWMYFALIITHLLELTYDKRKQDEPFPDMKNKEIQKIINLFLMITTDSVVYFLCKTFIIPAVYTGSREGVTSGRCSLKYFNVGDPDYASNLQNLIERDKNRIKQHNTTTIKCLEQIIEVTNTRTGTGLISLKLFNFQVQINFEEHLTDDLTSRRGPRKVKPPARFGMNDGDRPKIGVRIAAPIGNNVILNGNDIFSNQKPKRKQDISNELERRFKELIRTITSENEALDATFDKQSKELAEQLIKSETELNDNYNKKYDELKKHKCKQYITILPLLARVRGVKFIFNYTELLRIDDEMTFYRPGALQSTILSGTAVKFLKTMIPTDFYTLEEKNDVYGEDTSPEDDTLMEDESLESSKYEIETSDVLESTAIEGGGKEYIGTSSSIGYYESLIMYYIYTFFFNKKYIECPSNIEDDILLKNPLNVCLFAKYYDMFVWQCESNDWNIKLEEKPVGHFNKLFDKYTDKEIEMFGAKLSNYIQFFNANDPSIQQKDIVSSLSQTTQLKYDVQTLLKTPLSPSKDAGPIVPVVAIDPIGPVGLKPAVPIGPVDSIDAVDLVAKGSMIYKQKAVRRTKRTKRTKKHKRNKRNKRTKRNKRNKRNKRTKKHKHYNR